ncbi:MAG: hypothetical protein ACYDG2_15885 [Ruminiclostridium sp.]
MIVSTAFEYKNVTYEDYVLLSKRIAFRGSEKIVIIKDLNLALFELLKIDLTNDNEILTFIEKYGLLYNLSTDDSSVDIDTYRYYILSIKAIIGLKNSYEFYNYNDIIYWLCVITISGYPSYDMCAIDSPIQNFLFTFPKSSLNIFKCPSCIRFHIRSFRDNIPFNIDWNTLSFNYKFSFTRYFNNLNENQKAILSDSALKICVDIINQKIKNINLKMGYNFEGDWKADSLLDALYYIIFFKITNNTPLRKCSCSTCNGYFEIIGNYNKIYCSPECALLEAKRKERARKKSSINKLP